MEEKERLEQYNKNWNNPETSTNRQLNIIFNILSCFLGLIFILGKSQCIPNGVLHANFSLQICSVFLTLVMVPCALKMMNWKPIKKQVRGNLPRYRYWAIVRIAALQATAAFNLVAYFLLSDNSPLFCFLIVLASLLFISPSKTRLASETATDYPADV